MTPSNIDLELSLDQKKIPGEALHRSIRNSELFVYYTTCLLTENRRVYIDSESYPI